MRKILTILASVFLLSHLFFCIIQKGLQKYYVHQTERLSEILQGNTNYDCLFIGSSRTHDHINPEIIDSILQINSYNAGIDAANILEFKMILNSYLQHHQPPKYLILGVEPLCFDTKNYIKNEFQYYPFLNNSVIRNELQNNNKLTLAYYYFPFCQMTQHNDRIRTEIIKGWANKTELNADEWHYKGYRSNGYDTLQIGNLPPLCTEIFPSKPALSTLKNIITICNDNNINLIFTYYPTYNAYFRHRIGNHAPLLQSIDSIAKQHNITYLVHDTLSLFNKSDLFLDNAHLNTNGTTKYNYYLANKLQAIFRSYGDKKR